MKFSKLLISMSLAGGLAFGFVAPSTAQTTMKISISTSKNSHQGVGIDVFAQEVEKRTAGRYKVQTFYDGSLGGERESIEAVQLGTQELTLTSTGPVPNFVPETKIIDVPFLFRDKTHARMVLDGPFGADLLTKFDAKGFKALAWAENGFRHMTNSKRDVKVPVSERCFCTWSNLDAMMTDSWFSWPSTVPCCSAVNTSGKAMGVVTMPKPL